MAQATADTALDRTIRLEQQVFALDERFSRFQGQANGGIAAAMALGGTLMPPNADFALSVNVATYRGEQGFAASAVARLSDRVWLSGGIAGSTTRGSTGGRTGITIGW